MLFNTCVVSDLPKFNELDVWSARKDRGENCQSKWI